MTFKSALLLSRLKTAQMYPDKNIMIDFDYMTAGSDRTIGESFQEVSLRGYEKSIYSTLDYLQKLGYIEYNFETGLAYVTHAGWNATSMTVKSAVQFTVRDVIVPIIVAIATTIVLRYI